MVAIHDIRVHNGCPLRNLRQAVSIVLLPLKTISIFFGVARDYVMCVANNHEYEFKDYYSIFIIKNKPNNYFKYKKHFFYYE